MSGNFTKSIVEDAALASLENLGYAVLHLRAPAACAGHTGRQSGAARQAARTSRLKRLVASALWTE